MKSRRRFFTTGCCATATRWCRCWPTACAAARRAFEEQIAALAAAGVDLLVFANQQVYDTTIVDRTIDNVVNLVRTGQLTEARIDADQIHLYLEAYDWNRDFGGKALFTVESLKTGKGELHPAQAAMAEGNAAEVGAGEGLRPAHGRHRHRGRRRRSDLAGPV